MILLDTIQPDILSTLAQYGILGIFSMIMIIIIRYQDNTNKQQQKVLIDSFKEQKDHLIKDNSIIDNEKKELNAKFINHLQDTEHKLVSIISENTDAFKRIALSNDNINRSIGKLIDRLSENSNSNKELNNNILKIIK